MDEESIQGKYSNTTPVYMLRGGSIFLLTGSAIEAAPDGLSLWSKIYPSPFTASLFTFPGDLSNAPTDTSVGIPRALHIPILLRTSILWKQNQDRPVPLTQAEENWQQTLGKAIGNMANQNIVRDISPKLPTFSEETGFSVTPGVHTFNPLS